MDLIIFLAAGFGMSVATWVVFLILAVLILPDKIAESGRHGKTFQQLATAYIMVCILAGYALASRLLI